MGHPGCMPPLPTPFRAAIGLAASMLDEARHLPDKAIELPMLAVSRALQLSMRAQQRYATYAARGDELLAGRFTGDEPPEWAKFDDPVPPPVVVADPPADTVAADTVAADTVAAVAADTVAADTAAAATATAATDTDAEPSRTNHSARRPRAGKTVRAPRTGAPSAFDAVPDDDPLTDR
jgi:hypothetical protein